MADKRLYDLDEGSADDADRIIIDKSGNAEAERITLADLVIFVRNSMQYYTTVTNATKNNQITHNLDSTLVQLLVFDNNGKPFQGVNYTIDDSDNITPAFAHTLTGTWKIVIIKLRES